MYDRVVTVEDREFWTSASAPPHPALREFLTAYEGYRMDGEPARMHTLPIRTAVLIISIGEPLRLALPGRSGDFGSFVAGMHDAPGSYEHAGRLQGIQLDLTPLGAFTLLGVPMRELTNAAVELSDLLGPQAGHLVERLRETPDWGRRFDLLDRLLLERLASGPCPSPEVARAWRLLSGTAGRITVGSLADDVGWSRKHLINRFRDQVGLSPKVMGRVLRFHRAMDLMEHGVPNYVDIAVTCGFYDQAHMNREFRALAGCTPTELLALRRPQPL